MEVLLPTLTNVSEACALLDIDQQVTLPQVVVIGLQSMGKSSVLGFVAGRDVFPVGLKGVTKRPVELRMETSENVDDSFTFLSQTYTNSVNVRAAIEAELKKSGTGEQPLIVTFSSSRNPNITLVDLPAIDSGPEATDAALKYIAERNTLILAVFAATESAFDESALSFARKADPFLSRTFAVVTKVDLLRHETDLVKAMEHAFGELHLGSVAVICRSQTDIMVKVSLAQHRRVERTFFKTHMKRGEQGIDQLMVVVNQFLQAYIVKTIGKLRKDADKRLQTLRDQAGTRLPDDSAEGQSTRLYSLLMGYDKDVKQMFAGSQEIYQIRVSMGDKLKDRLTGDSPLMDVSDERLVTLIANARGLGGSVFMPRLALELLVDLEFPFLLRESLACLEQICSEIRAIAYSCMLNGALKNFPVLCVAIRKEVDSFLDYGHKQACEHISDLIEVQQAFLNLQHPNFVGDTEALRIVIEAIDWENPPGGRIVEALVLRTLAESYSQILRTLVCDQIPKVVICYLVTPLQDSVFERLAAILLTKERYRELLEEVGEEKLKRDELHTRIRRAEQAIEGLIQAETLPLY